MQFCICTSLIALVEQSIPLRAHVIILIRTCPSHPPSLYNKPCNSDLQSSSENMLCSTKSIDILCKLQNIHFIHYSEHLQIVSLHSPPMLIHYFERSQIPLSFFLPATQMQNNPRNIEQVQKGTTRTKTKRFFWNISQNGGGVLPFNVPWIVLHLCSWKEK